MTKKLLLSLALCLGLTTAAWAQTTIKGIVTDETGEPLIGAGVLVEGTTIGTITGHGRRLRPRLSLQMQ